MNFKVNKISWTRMWSRSLKDIFNDDYVLLVREIFPFLSAFFFIYHHCSSLSISMLETKIAYTRNDLFLCLFLQQKARNRFFSGMDLHKNVLKVSLYFHISIFEQQEPKIRSYSKNE